MKTEDFADSPNLATTAGQKQTDASTDMPKAANSITDPEKAAASSVMGADPAIKHETLSGEQEDGQRLSHAALEETAKTMENLDEPVAENSDSQVSSGASSPKPKDEAFLSDSEIDKVYLEWSPKYPKGLSGIIGPTAVKARKTASEEEKRAIEKDTGVDGVLSTLDLIRQVSSKFTQGTRLKDCLEALVKPQHGFSALTVGKAQNLYNRFATQSWGEPVVPAQSSTIPSSNAVPPVNQSAPTDKKRKRAPGAIVYPDPDHPIFGNDGIMHGLAYRQNAETRTKSFVFNDRAEHVYRKVEATKYGHNNLEVGQWFAYRICVFRDGAHGEIQAGIHGNELVGAYSIVISDSKYSALDKDKIDTIEYSAPRSDENTDKDEAIETSGSKALRQSMNTGKEVRVIRGSKRKSTQAPAVGFRYEGLYTVTGSITKKNTKGGMYQAFVLKRNAGQPDVDLDRPTKEEIEDYRKIKEYY